MDNTNQNHNTVIETIRNINSFFWQALGDRDSAKRFECCADHVTFIGTGLHEKASSKAEYLAINLKGLEQYPDQFTIEPLWERINVFGSFACLENELEWTQLIDGKVVKQLTRNTVLFEHKDNHWLIVHVHGSAPDFRLSGDNYMTNSETIQRNQELELQVYERTRELKNAMDELRNTQAQLIHAEKMSSLGELTAGIAHEIQNPLNFVNNFSEINIELADEIQAAIDNNETDAFKEIATSIKENQEKILFHGKRAADIVKGMLQHSRSGTGIRENTDINQLVDEYLRLAYHGLRAKDKSFNATLKTSFASDAGTIEIVSQDIGRVILNLVTNAFYAVSRRKKEEGGAFDPVVEVSTRRTGTHCFITVKDNGGGIPPAILDKIFQPFFTTKPAGEGTGLGLSMSYDIITKGHHGELSVETSAGEGSLFTITLPLS